MRSTSTKTANCLGVNIASMGIFLLSGLLLVSCSDVPSDNALVGKWMDCGSAGSIIEFFEDGTFSSEETSGTYLVLEDGRLKLDSAVFGSQQITVFDEVKIDSGVLSCVDRNRSPLLLIRVTDRVLDWKMSDEEFFSKLQGKWEGETKSSDGLSERSEQLISKIRWSGIDVMYTRFIDQSGLEIASGVVVPTSKKGRYIGVETGKNGVFFSSHTISGLKTRYEVLFPVSGSSYIIEGGFDDDDTTSYEGVFVNTEGDKGSTYSVYRRVY